MVQEQKPAVVLCPARTSLWPSSSSWSWPPTFQGACGMRIRALTVPDQQPSKTHVCIGQERACGQLRACRAAAPAGTAAKRDHARSMSMAVASSATPCCRPSPFDDLTLKTHVACSLILLMHVSATFVCTPLLCTLLLVHYSAV